MSCLSSASPLSPPLLSSELTDLLEKLQEAAAALLAASAPSPAVSGGEALSSAAVPGEGETRAYYFSPSVLRQERELLERYGAKDVSDLLEQAQVMLAGLMKLMQNMHPDVRLKGRVIINLGRLLEQVSMLLLRMRNLYVRVEALPH